jgi:hypothetical protein
MARFDEPPRSQQQAATLPPPSQQLPAGDSPPVDKKKEAGKKKSHKTLLDPLDSALQRALEGSSRGHISYNPPDKMTEGQTVRVTVQLLRPNAQGKIVSSPDRCLAPDRFSRRTWTFRKRCTLRS